MTHIVLMKTANVLVPYDEAAADFVQKMKSGSLMHSDFKKVRNYKFHKKYFALVTFAFDQWEPQDGLTYQGQPVTKNKERFRKDVAILAGFFESTVNLKGEVRLEAKSVSFAQMDEIEFEALYSATVDVVLRKVLTNYSKSDLENVVNQLLEFT